jgi:hypothetical protein
MKLIETREPFWILVQAHRVGRVQIAHSAWRLYGREIDLTSVTEPLTALKKFVDVFGVTITVNGQEFLFVDGQRFEGKQIEANYREGTFSSLANVRDKYGLGYSIDLPKYAQSLISYGVDVKFKPGLVQQFVQATGTQPISRLKTT